MALSGLFALLLAFTWIISDLAVQRSTPGVVAAGRSLFSTLGLCGLAARRRGGLRRAWGQIRSRPAALAGSGLIGVAAYAFFSLWGIDALGVSVPNLLLATTPCLSMLIGAAVFRITVPRLGVVGVVAASAGAVAYVLGSFRVTDTVGPAAWWGVAACVVAVVAIALYGQHYAWLSRGHDPLDLLPGIFGFGTLALFIALTVTGHLHGLISLDLTTLGLLVVLGVVIYVPVYVIQHLLIHRQGAVYMASISLIVPFLVRAVDLWWLHAPPPGLAETLGMLACLAGVLLVVRHPAR